MSSNFTVIFIAVNAAVLLFSGPNEPKIVKRLETKNTFLISRFFSGLQTNE